MKKTMTLLLIVLSLSTISTQQAARPAKITIRVKRIDAETQHLMDSLCTYSESMRKERLKGLLATIILNKKIEELKKQDSVLSLTKR